MTVKLKEKMSGCLRVRPAVSRGAGRQSGPNGPPAAGRGDVVRQDAPGGNAAIPEDAPRLAKETVNSQVVRDFVGGARVRGGNGEELSGALAEAGCHIGRAYQLADDLTDQLGDECPVGKILGTDPVRGEFTLAQAGEEGGRFAQQRVDRLYASVLDCLSTRPAARAALMQFLAFDLKPGLSRHLGVRMRSGV